MRGFQVSCSKPPMEHWILVLPSLAALPQNSKFAFWPAWSGERYV